MNQKKFYRKGDLIEKGCKLSIKTRPIIAGGLALNEEDPISSFKGDLTALKTIVREYRLIQNIPGLKETINSSIDLNDQRLNAINSLLDFLIEAPTEMTLKANNL